MAERQLATLAVRQGIESDTQYGAVVPPIYLSTNYASMVIKIPANSITVVQATQRAAF